MKHTERCRSRFEKLFEKEKKTEPKAAQTVPTAPVQKSDPPQPAPALSYAHTIQPWKVRRWPTIVTIIGKIGPDISMRMMNSDWPYSTKWVVS